MNKSIKTRTRYTLVSADYSQQEPRLLTEYSKDPKFLDAYMNGKDMYATIGTGVFNNDYWDNMEHHEDGSANVEGKKRRSMCKKLLLGMMYGMGPGLLAQNLGCTKEEAEKIVQDFYNGFPQVQKWIKETEANAAVNGYVEDLWGRRRRLPDILLPKIEVKYSKFNNSNFNPILGAENKYVDNESSEILEYKKRAEECKGKFDLDKLKAEAERKGIYIKDNNGFISAAQRQCVNSRIQGGAATMTKRAMISIARDKEINDLGFHILIGVHDELIGECPEENSEACAERLSYLMRNAVPELSVPFKCDAEIEDHWYLNTYSHFIQDEYNKYLEEMNENDAYAKLKKEHCELLEEQLKDIINSNE